MELKQDFSFIKNLIDLDYRNIRYTHEFFDVLNANISDIVFQKDAIFFSAFVIEKMKAG